MIPQHSPDFSANTDPFFRIGVLLFYDCRPIYSASFSCQKNKKYP